MKQNKITLIALGAILITATTFSSCDTTTEKTEITSEETQNNQATNNLNIEIMGTTITLKGNEFQTVGKLPEVGSELKNFTLTDGSLGEKTLADYKGQFLVLNIFPSIDTPVCAQSVRTFNEKAASMENTKVLCISKDLPFAQANFCSSEGIENVINLSDFRTNFGHEFGLEIANGPLKGLLSRAVIIVNPEGKVIHTEQVPEIGQEPNYEMAISAIAM